MHTPGLDNISPRHRINGDRKLESQAFATRLILLYCRASSPRRRYVFRQARSVKESRSSFSFSNTPGLSEPPCLIKDVPTYVLLRKYKMIERDFYFNIETC